MNNQPNIAEAALKSSLDKLNVTAVQGLKATAAFAETVWNRTASFSPVADAPEHLRAFECRGNGCSVLITEVNDQGKFYYEGVLVTTEKGHPLVVRLLPDFVCLVFQKIIGQRN